MVLSRSGSTRTGFPLRRQIRRLAREDRHEDAFGNPESSWRDAGRIPAAGWEINSSTEKGPTDGDSVRRVDWSGTVYVAPGALRAGDHVVIQGAEFKVVDGGQDFTHGPWWDPGLVPYAIEAVKKG